MVELHQLFSKFKYYQSFLRKYETIIIIRIKRSREKKEVGQCSHWKVGTTLTPEIYKYTLYQITIELSKRCKYSRSKILFTRFGLITALVLVESPKIVSSVLLKCSFTFIHNTVELVIVMVMEVVVIGGSKLSEMVQKLLSISIQCNCKDQYIQEMKMVIQMDSVLELAVFG
ncbi:hypothetical protein ACTA71_006623 [Dictyostelium dimigraforme]